MSTWARRAVAVVADEVVVTLLAVPLAVVGFTLLGRFALELSLRVVGDQGLGNVGLTSFFIAVTAWVVAHPLYYVTAARSPGGTWGQRFVRRLAGASQASVKRDPGASIG